MTAGLAGLVLLLAPAAAHGTGVPDQSQTAIEGQAAVGGVLWYGQTFTAGMSGSLDQVDLALKRIGPVVEPLTVEIYATSAGFPVGSALGSGTVGPGGLSGSSFSWAAVTISPAVSMTSGQKYVIVLSTHNQLGEDYAVGAACETSVYSGGNVIVSTNSGSTWSSQIPCDLAFRTYVVEDSTAPTVSLVTPAQGAVYSILDSPVADYTCADEGGSGLASCVGTLPDGAPVPHGLLQLGQHTFTVTATDNAGNSTTVSHTYRVTLLGLGIGPL